MRIIDNKKTDVTTSIILDSRIARKSDLYPVKLRVIYNRKYKDYTLKKEHLSIDEFEKVMAKSPKGQYKDKKKKFESVENRAIDIIDNVLNQFSFDAFEREYLEHKKQDISIQSYFETKATELDKEDKIQTATLYRSTLKSLLQFDNKISFQKITPKYLKHYEKYMLDENNTYTTIGMYLRNFKHIINRAIKNRVINEYPFGQDKDKYTIPASKNTKKALTITDIEKLFKYSPVSQNEYLALNYWLFSYLSNGMNMVDIANLKYKDIKENSIEFIRQKTKDTVKERFIIKISLIPELQEIINSLGNEDKSPGNYIFPIFKAEFSEIEKHNRLKQHIKNTNKYIKRVAKNIGINENITTYWARHSYSTILKRSGAPIEFISEQLGHHSTQVTQSYLDSFEDEQREKYSKSLLDFKKD